MAPPPNSCSQVLPPLHHEDLMATADDQMGQKSEPTRDPVNVTRSGNFSHEKHVRERMEKVSFKASHET